MHKYFIILITLLIIALPVAAQDRLNAADRTDRRDEAMERAEVKREEFVEKREEFRKNLEARKTEIRDKRQTHRDQLRAKLNTLRDEKKRVAVERIDQHISDLNERVLAHFVRVVDALENILERIISKADEAADSGSDVSNVRAAVSRAESAIGEAREAIREQAGKVYEITITEDARLKADVSATRREFRNDMEVIRHLVVIAHEAVKASAQALREALLK